MGMGSLTLACVMMLANAGAEPEISYLPSTRMNIPITIDPAKRDTLSGIILFCSMDEGKTWDQKGLAKPEEKGFPFTAPHDGLYWFTIQTIDKNNVKSPLDPAMAPVGQKIIVDTVKPLVKLKADRKGDEILVSWAVTEEHPNPVTFVVEYHTPDQPPLIWTPVAAMPKAEDTVPIKPAPTSSVSIRLRVKDMADNEGSAVAEVAPATPVAPPPPTPSNPLPLTPPIGVPGSGSPPPFPGSASSVGTPLRGALPPKLLINKSEARLDFDVNNLGPSGFGSVDVYETTDDGVRWTQLTLEPGAVQTPEMRGPGQARGNVLVHLPVEGKVYGFYLVVISHANLHKDPPVSGTLPQIRLESDITVPKATLDSALADPTRHDTLILKWTATDKNLTERPVTLQWAPKIDGPWEFIGGPELPHTGSFAWQVPPAAAAATSVYLKLTVRDGAGNVAVAVTEKPVVVDLNVPEVTGVILSPSR
jgi:hypothetical protein